MTSLTDDIEALLASEEKNVRAREAAEDEKKRQQQQPERSRGNDPRLNSQQNRYSAEREENDRRRSRKSGDHTDDTVMRDASEDGSANGSDGNRRAHRDTGRRARGGYRSSSHSPDHNGPRRDRPSGDYYNGGGRPSRTDEYRPNSRRSPPSRGRSRSPPRGGRDRRDPRDDRGRRRSPYGGGGGRRGRRDAPPTPTDDERDRRTVFVQQLVVRLRTKELSKFFEQAGPVVEAQIVKDRISMRSKGVGYVEFKSEESVEKAIALTGQKLLGQPIIVQPTEAEKNRQTRTEGGATQSNGVPFHRLYVGNIHFSITEDDLKNVFEPFGELEFVQLQKEEQMGRSKGYGFVQYHDPAEAKEALEKMNGFELAGRAIRVGLGNDKFTNESTQNLLRTQAPQFTGSAFSGSGGRGSHAGGNANFDRASGKDQEKAGGASALDDTDVGGVNFSNYSRDSLMRKLARTEDPEPKVQPKASQQKKAPVAQTPASRCVLLKNMYNQAEEEGTEWQQELTDDVKTECEDKYGKVMHIGLNLNNDDGEVFIKFDRLEGGQNAIRGLNGRWFGGKMISADYVIEAMYNANFPKAKNL